MRTDVALCAQHSAKVTAGCGRVRPCAHSTRPMRADGMDGCRRVRTAIGRSAQMGWTVSAAYAQRPVDARGTRQQRAKLAGQDGCEAVMDGYAGSVKLLTMAEQSSLANRVAELETQVRRLMELLGQAPASPPVALFPRINTLNTTVGEWPDLMGQRAEVNLLKGALGREEDRAPVSKVKVPDPKPFGGARSAKELENFLWDMEAYFQATRIPDDEKVSITSMYLTGDAKLWWHTRLSNDASANREKIETWDVLKKELKDQFLLCNTSWLAKESLRKLKYSGTVRNYVKDFSSLMLDVRDMSEETSCSTSCRDCRLAVYDGTKTSGRQGLAVCDCCR
ncbi:UNVERIFIED_CONTAM: hypothetical protein Sradi_5759500 [Sesamum radiatum]|uniref:Retrotransposon gag domain-containing protein n=1 Tax=Sesamum radiatum TaxID=300843 RepID=A0AAW2L4J3_SESRA